MLLACFILIPYPFSNIFSGQVLYFLRWLRNHSSLVAQTVKRLPAMRETRVRFLGWEDPLAKEMAIHSSTLAWKIPWTEEPGPWGRKESDTTERLHFHFHLGIISLSLKIPLFFF